MSNLETRNAQVLAMTEEEREQGDESNPIIFAESGPNRFATMTLFFEDVSGGVNDGVRIEEDLDLNEITIYYFSDTQEQEQQLTEGAVYDWALNFYRDNY